MSVTPTNKQVWKNKWRGRTEPVNPFARSLAKKVRKGNLLDVGCGNGTDSLFFVTHGLTVTATDFSKSGIDILRVAAKERELPITMLLHDTAKKFPFKNSSFDVIYAHLALHYFNDTTTRKIFAEMKRLLKPGGLFFVKCKSTDDALYGVGTEVGPDMYRSDHTRHFFSREYMKSVIKDFRMLSLRSSRSSYHGKTSAFISAVASK